MQLQKEVQLLRKELRPLRQRIAQLDRSWQQQKVRANKLEQENHQLQSIIKLLTKENIELREKLVSTNAHKDNLAGMIFKTNVKKSESENGHKLGGQPEHKGYGREKPKHIDQEKDVHLSDCPDCGNKLKQSITTYERVVEDIQPSKVLITQYHIQRQWCCHCNKEVRAVPQGTLEGFRVGINLIVWLLFHKYRLRIPLAKIEETLKEQYDLELSQGGIQNILHRLKKQFGKKYKKIIKEIRKSKVKHADETGWRIQGTNNWCWLFATNKAAYYTIEETRGKGVPDNVLGKNPQGIIVRDDFGSYKHLPMEQQSCWVHLLRKSREATLQKNVSNEVRVLHTELKQMFYELKSIIESKFEKRKRNQAYQAYLKKLETIQKRKYKHSDSKSIQKRIQNQGKNLLTAIKYEGVPLTNNHAEQQIRPMVVARKISGGSRSNKGAATHAVNMSVIQTIFLEGKSFFTGIKKLLLS